MKSFKQILQQEMGVALLETRIGSGALHDPVRVSYSVSSMCTPKIRSFDDLASAISCFDDEIMHCKRSLHLRNRGPVHMLAVGAHS